jgi:hypothetical protein
VSQSAGNEGKETSTSAEKPDTKSSVTEKAKRK